MPNRKGRSEPIKQARREQRSSRGRPKVRSDDETRHVIAEAARNVFVENGYQAANVDQVASLASVSKKTLYRLFPTKEDIFRFVISDRASLFMLSLDQTSLSEMPLESGLTRIMTEYGLLTLAQDTVELQRLILAESDRFPEIAADFYQEAMLPVQRVLIDFLRQRRLAGELEFKDPVEASQMLRGMMIFEHQRSAMMRLRPLPNAKAVTALAKRCVELFLNGCLVSGTRAKI